MNKPLSADKIKYLFYTMSHPMDGFYWLRHDDSRGSVLLSAICVLIFSLSFTGNRLLAGFVVNDLNPKGVDLFYELLGVLAAYLLLCVSNWSVTCLMSGEGRVRDIAIAVGYATVPMTMGFIIATIVSRFLADGEEAFYTLILAVFVVYGLIIMLMGIMQVHNYSLGKTLFTVFLTLLALLIILFLLLLLSNLLGLVFNFFRSAYFELIFKA